MKYLYLALSSIIIAYLLVMIFIYFYQRNLLYHPSENNYQNDEIEFSYDEIFIKVDNIELKSWLIHKDFKKFKTLVFFKVPAIGFVDMSSPFFVIRFSGEQLIIE